MVTCVNYRCKSSVLPVLHRYAADPAPSGGNPSCHKTTTGVLLDDSPLYPMSLVPRWRFMTDEAKALTKRTAVTAGVVLLVLLVFRALVPWVLLAVVGWWIWRAVKK